MFLFLHGTLGMSDCQNSGSGCGRYYPVLTVTLQVRYSHGDSSMITVTLSITLPHRSYSGLFIITSSSCRFFPESESLAKIHQHPTQCLELCAQQNMYKSGHWYLWMRVFAVVTKLRWDPTECDWALNPVASVLIRKGRLGTPREQMGRCQRRRRQNLQWLIPKPGIPRNRKTLGKAGRFLPEVPAYTLTRTLGLQNWEIIHFSCYSSFRNLKHHWCPCFSQA